ncbi:Fur family transcriptional regulator [Syntrophobacter fumaroxidans]|uniref:Ferric uptake regulator, Fur family n=1 Tax=Syntrophobacter fumaroxidans (strain DSM 10017 / MPOB) TaxID=335543 RepID=A0LLP4_SYNFM|nr:transcriptional repressor [Syntrophobacter fumaroxidans]ABK18346.1 ferric uptake regulator, Fur family [Syntrophobacter fumaroxidans MPOB]
MNGMDDTGFISILREHGLQVTYQRLAIYQALYHSKEHPSAEEIHQQVGRRFSMISLGTVYKTLERFSEAGLIDKINPVAEVARYDANLMPHHHFVCVQCQAIYDLEGVSDDESPMRLDGYEDFKVLKRQVILRGYCPKCRPRGTES